MLCLLMPGMSRSKTHSSVCTNVCSYLPVPTATGRASCTGGSEVRSGPLLACPWRPCLVCSHLIVETVLLNQAYSLGDIRYLLGQFDGLPLRLRVSPLAADC